MARRKAVFAVFAIAIAGSSGCGFLTDPETTEELAFITGFDSEDPVVDVPAVVTAGEEFTVHITTYGSNSCWTRGRTDVELSGSAITVTPYDNRSGERNCADVVGLFDHSVSITIPDSGVAELKIRGRDMPSGTEVTFTFPLQVES